MAVDPQMAAMMAAQQGGDPNAPNDEAMLEQVRSGMGQPQGQGAGPPPGSGMKWVNLQEDQAALENDPSPENVQAFVQYWGQENLPPDLQEQMAGGQGGQGAAPPEAGEGE